MDTIIEYKVVHIELNSTFVIYDNYVYFTSHKLRNFVAKYEKILAVMLI